jgi:hypothetical protein
VGTFQEEDKVFIDVAKIPVVDWTMRRSRFEQKHPILLLEAVGKTTITWV